MTSSSNGESLEEDSDNILEGTLALIKPDAVDRAKDIISIILSEGFLIVEKKRFRFSREVIWKYYCLVRRIKLIKFKMSLYMVMYRLLCAFDYFKIVSWKLGRMWLSVTIKKVLFCNNCKVKKQVC